MLCNRIENDARQVGAGAVQGGAQVGALGGSMTLSGDGASSGSDMKNKKSRRKR